MSDEGPIIDDLPDDAGQPENPRLYPNRTCFHKNMGPPQDYPCCGGRGWFLAMRDPEDQDPFPDTVEKYCDCRAGREKRRGES